MDKMFRQGNWVALKGNFDIKMSDFGINPPSMLAMKVSNEINIDVDVMAMKK